MALTLLPAKPAKSRTSGRPCLTESEADVARMIECARARFLYKAKRATLARYYGVSVRTVVRWTNRALEMDGPDSDALRRIADQRRAS